MDVPSVQLYTYKDLDTSRVYTKLKSNKRMEETLTPVQARTSYSLKQEIIISHVNQIVTTLE